MMSSVRRQVDSRSNYEYLIPSHYKQLILTLTSNHSVWDIIRSSDSNSILAVAYPGQDGDETKKEARNENFSRRADDRRADGNGSRRGRGPRPQGTRLAAEYGTAEGRPTKEKS